MIDGIGQFISEILTPAFLVDWATMAVSLFNMIVLLWLGLTVVLNAETPRWGVWLAGGGLLLGGPLLCGALCHAGPRARRRGRWHGLLVAGRLDTVVILPYVWYGVMLWYSGFWDGRNGAVRRRHLWSFTLASLMLAGLVFLFVFFNPLPVVYRACAAIPHPVRVGLTRLQVLVVFYPVYAILCMGLSLDVVMRPESFGPGDGRPCAQAGAALADCHFVCPAGGGGAGGVGRSSGSCWECATIPSPLYLLIMQSPVYWFDLVTSLLVAFAYLFAGSSYRVLRDFHRQDPAASRLCAPVAKCAVAGRRSTAFS